MLKVLKFGGSSMADAKQFEKVKSIVQADPARRVVIVSAAGKRFSDDHKLTDLLYLCFAHLKYGVSCDSVFNMIRSRYIEIRDHLELKTDLETEFDALRRKMDAGISQDELVSRGEYFAAKLMADYLGYDFLDSELWLKFNLDGTVDQEKSYEILARMANGALRDALSLLDQCRVAQGQLDSRAVLDILGLAGSVQTVELMDCILRRDAAGALTRLDGLYRGGKDVAAMLGELGDLARDMTILKAAPDGAAALLTGIYDTKTLKSLSGSQPMRRFLYLTETLQSCCAGLGDSFQPRTDAELCLLRLCDESLSGDLTALSQRIDRLEDQAANGIPVKTVPQTAGTSPKTAPLSRDNAGTSRDVPSDDRPPMPEEPPLPEEPGGRERVYDIPDEESPVVRPAAKPARKPPAAKSAAVVGDTGKWDAMKEHCKGRLAVNHRVFLNMVQGAVDGDCLTLYCQNEFVRDSLNNNTVLHVLQEVASAAEGRTIRVALTVGGATAGKKPAKPRPKPEKVTEKAPEKSTEKVPEPEQTPPWEEPPAEKAPDKLDEVAAQGRQLENFKIK